MTSPGKQYYEMNRSGMSYRQIAAMHGVTLGTVAGAIRRYRIGLDETTPDKPNTLARARKREVPGKIKLADLQKNDCRWPFGEGPYTFCGQRVVDGMPYCEFHNLKARKRDHGNKEENRSKSELQEAV